MLGDKMRKLQMKMQEFMKGRYGPDLLSRDMSFLSLGIIILNLFLRNTILYVLGLTLLLLSYLRMFSKTFPKRYNENRIYANIRNNFTKRIKRIFNRIKDFPKYKYFKCPSCQKQLRVPRGKKQIVVTCPVCRTKFDAKT